MEEYILVVEDDYKSQQLLQQFLTSNGYKVDCANDGLEGIQTVSYTHLEYQVY